MLTAFLSGVVIGSLAELVARTFGLWRYRKPIYPILNVLLVFGGVMAALSLQIPAYGWPLIVACAYVIGLAYELVDLHILDWWYFPDDRFLLFRGRLGCAMSVAVLWAGVPLFIYLLGMLITG